MITETLYIKYSNLAKRIAAIYGTIDPEECYSYITTHTRFLSITNETPESHIYLTCKSLAMTWYRSTAREANHINEQLATAEYNDNQWINSKHPERLVENAVINNEANNLIQELFRNAKLTKKEIETITAKEYPITGKEIARLQEVSEKCVEYTLKTARNKMMAQTLALMITYKD